MDKPKKKDCGIFHPDFLIIDGHNDTCDEFSEYFKHLLSKIPSDKKIGKMKACYTKDFARAYYQGQFDILMELIGEPNNEG